MSAKLITTMFTKLMAMLSVKCVTIRALTAFLIHNIIALIARPLLFIIELLVSRVMENVCAYKALMIMG